MNEMAKELVQFYQADEGFAGKEQFVICADDINLGLNHMQAYGDLQPDLGDVRDVVERIEGLQQLTGGLVVDGMLGRRTLRFMRSVPRCPNHPTNDFFDLLRLSSRGKEVLYFVHDLPNVTGGERTGDSRNCLRGMASRQ
ncbi:MAG: hypothetical protein HOL01_25205 [Planctomycetaceae bacterium]|jgi:hypothetical protein|nr:hypothetical protein [Planctomycetaceae bacterium]MBT6488036.1 hypothetical protein [Planctomycetaceae bacterium]MBT6497824.1 hypothetical protein [Planctomycetaceae bacterium]